MGVHHANRAFWNVVHAGGMVDEEGVPGRMHIDQAVASAIEFGDLYLESPAMTSSSRRSGIKLNRPFVGIPSFLRAPIETNIDCLEADIAVYGVPFDEGSPFLAGSRMGPRSIREHSLRFAASDSGFHDPETGRTYLAYEMTNRTIADVGDVDVWPTDVKSTFDNATDLTRAVLAREALPVVLGGDHSVTYPIVKGYEGQEPIHVIHFDAHIDYAPFIHDLRFTNTHTFRHITPMEHVLSLAQVGIRSLRSAGSEIQDSIDDGNRVMTMGEFHAVGPDGRRRAGPGGCAHLREHRYRRAGSAADPGVRLGGTERYDLR